MDYNKLAYLNKLKQQVSTRAAYLGAKEKALNSKQRLYNNNLVPNTGARTLQQNLGASLDSGMVPGNVGDINSVIWPFYFTTPFQTVPAQTSYATSFSITQEASFIWMSYMKVVYTFDEGSGAYTYIDPDQPGATGHAFNLQVSIKDGISSRDFQNFPFDLDTVGNPAFPMKFPKPSLFLPNATVEIDFYNNDPALTYVPFLTAFGYRLRIENSQDILSMVTSG